jgi:CMP-N,N'-diacetyllegionaminic acid synthase
MNLFLIPARGGSKGLPGKNIKPLSGKPLIIHSLEFAHQCKNVEDIVLLSTDDHEIKAVAEQYGYKVPFLRPAELASDTSSVEEAINFALEEYKKSDIVFNKIILLQPTSPFRNTTHYRDMMQLHNGEIEMVVSVSLSKQNPYFNLFEEQANGYLTLSKKSDFARRQDCPDVYQYNGNIYIIDVNALSEKKRLVYFDKIKKYVMGPEYAIDIDTELDFKFAEEIAKNNHG